MKKQGLLSFLPSVVSHSCKEDPSHFRDYIACMEDVVKYASAKAYAKIQQYLATTEDTDIQCEYLRMMGFDLSEVDHETVCRMFTRHRDYLEHRGTSQGIKILCEMIVNQTPELDDAPVGNSMSRVGQRLEKNLRLNPYRRAPATLRLSFKEPLTQLQCKTLRRYLANDQPCGVKIVLEGQTFVSEQREAGEGAVLAHDKTKSKRRKAIANNSVKDQKPINPPAANAMEMKV